MADASTTGCSPSSTSPSSSSPSAKLTKSALTAHDKAFAAVASSSTNPRNRPYTPAAGLTSRRYSTPGVQVMKMTIPISPPPSVSGKSHLPSSASPQSPVGPGYTFPMTPSASTASGPSRRASLTSSQSVAHAFGYTNATTSTPSRYFPLPSPVDPSLRAAATSSALPKVPTPNLDTIQEVSSAGSGTNSRSGSTVARGGGPPTPVGSVKGNHSRAGSLSNRSAVSSLTGSPSGRRPSTSKSSYFHWEPGAAPMSIYDPDYPNGSPECLSPRRLSTATSSSSADETQAKDYFSQPIRRHHHEDRSSPRLHRQQRQSTTPAKTVVSASPPFKDKDALPPTPGDVVSITPSPPTSTKCDTPHTEEFEIPLSLSEFPLSNNRMGTLDSIFGLVTSDDQGRHPLGAIPWNEMPQFIRRHNREVERREREREKVIAKDKAIRETKKREKMTVTEARLVAGEWKMMDEIPPTLELIQRAGREEEKRMRVRIDGTVELTGIGFLRDLPLDEQRKLLTERSELDKWLKGEVKEKPKFLVEEKEAYEKRLKDGKENARPPLEGRKVALIEAPPPPPTVVVSAAQTGPVKLASVAEVDEPADNPEERSRPASPAGT